MLILLALLGIAVSPADSFQVRVTAPADLPLVVTYQLDRQPLVTHRVKGSTNFRIPTGTVRVTVASERQTEEFSVQVRGPRNRIIGRGNGQCIVEINATRNKVKVTADALSTCRTGTGIQSRS